MKESDAALCPYSTRTLPGTYNAVLGPYRGDEADNIRAFKEALGLSDEDAAPAHIDVGRRIMRSRFEASTRSGNSDQFRALQKLIYVSDLVSRPAHLECGVQCVHFTLGLPGSFAGWHHQAPRWPLKLVRQDSLRRATHSSLSTGGVVLSVLC